MATAPASLAHVLKPISEMGEDEAIDQTMPGGGAPVEQVTIAAARMRRRTQTT